MFPCRGVDSDGQRTAAWKIMQNSKTEIQLIFQRSIFFHFFIVGVYRRDCMSILQMTWTDSQVLKELLFPHRHTISYI